MLKIFCSSYWLKSDVFDNICKSLKIQTIVVNDPNNSDIIFFSNYDRNLFDNFNAKKILFNFEPSNYYHNCDLYFSFAETSEKNYSFPYFLCWQNLILDKNPIDYNTNNIRKDCCYMYSQNIEHRSRLLSKIKNVLNVDSLGYANSEYKDNKILNQILHDRHSEGWVERAIEKYKNYKYVISCENSFGENYITEKIILPFLAGAIPIYCGTKDVFKWFNKNSFIYIPPEDIDNADKIIKNSINNYEKMQKEYILNNGIIEEQYTYKYYTELILNKMYNKKIVILCMSCYKNEEYFQKLEWVRKYKLIKENFPNIYIYRILGNNKNNVKIQENIPIINVECPDNYEYLITKVFKSIKVAYEIHKDLDYLVKVDDDVEINIIKLANLLNKNDIDYGGFCMDVDYQHITVHHKGKCESDDFNNKNIILEPFKSCAGPIYVLGKKSVNIINNNKIPTPDIDILNEDVYMGNLLIKYNNINRTDLYNLYSDFYYDYIHNDQYISWHNFNKSEYYELEQIKFNYF
jgi:hypothetical protein